MGAPQSNKYIMAKMQWLYIDELVGLGYEALRTRSGKDTEIALTGPDGIRYSMYIMILNDHNADHSVWVHSEICVVQGDTNKSTPLISGFTVFSSGKIEGHS
jgi:hypothetical protein